MRQIRGLKLDERLVRTPDNYLEAYHRTEWENVDSIIANGFRPGYGAMYGKGWYFTYDLASQTRADMTHYGDALLKCRINPKNLLIFDYNVSKDLFGDEYSLLDQLVKHYKIYISSRDVPMPLYNMSLDLEKTFTMPVYSADVAYNQFVKSFVKSGHTSVSGIRGIVFTGNHDGNVLVSYAWDTSVPVEVALTDSDTGEMSQKFQPLQNVAAIDRAKQAEIALQLFKGKVKRLHIDNYPWDDIKKNFKWLLNASFQDAEVEIKDDGSLIWMNGVWKSGTWRGDEWLAGEWKSGHWESGTFKGGNWHFGNFDGGVFESGIWADGVWTKGSWTAPSYNWHKGTIMDGARAVKDVTISPIEYFNQ